MEKGGLKQALARVGITAQQAVGWADEMRIGLRGQVRRVWGRRGIPVRQRVQLRYEWRWLALIVDGRAGRLWWTWLARLTGDEVVAMVGGLKQAADLAALVWDRAPSHRDERLQALGLPRIELPPYAPELNPAERVIEEIRRAIEGKVYTTLDEKVAAAETVLQQLDADPARVRRLAGWAWIAAAFAPAPMKNAA